GRIRKVNSYGTLSTMSTAIAHPGSIALDSFGNVFVSDATANRIYRVAADGRATPFAGVDKPGFGGDQGPALQSVLASPSGLAFDALDSLYFADTGSGRIRKISPGGWISTVAGGGTREGDGIASESALSQPAGVAIDNQGTLFFSESGANRIRSLSRSGLLTTVADAASANLLRPGGLRVAPNGDIYVADAGNHRIRHIPAVGPATTIAGNGAPGFSGDDGPAAAAKLSSPSDVALDSAGNIWISDTGNNRIRKLTREPSTPGVGQISTVSVTHAATFKEQAVAPGEILSIFGSGLGPVVGAIAKLTSAGILETQVAEVQVLFDGRPAPLFYVQDQQINVQALYALSAQRSTEITVVYRGLVAARATLAVQDSVPGLLTLAGGTGQAVVMNENGVTNGMDSPASRGAVVVFYATGDGQLGADALDGKPAVFSPSSASVAVDIAGYPGEILYAGRAPGFVGLMQINVRLPAALAATGLQPITLSVNGAKSQPGVVLALQ
ncbi:MAG TPA: hypothetical protein VMZ52_13250, partial [Bryobacteraceae bacterium]|nr:hypothetical protein [Bryobacteraceae bacterium]